MLVLVIFIAIIAAVFTPILNWYLSLWKYASLRNIPGPKPLPIIGNANEIGRTTVDLLQSFMKLQNKYGTFYKLWLGTKFRLVITKPEYLEPLLNTHLSKSDGYEMLKPGLGDGLVVTNVEKWKIRRKMITPTFHYKILDGFMTVFNKQFDILVDIMSKEVENNHDKSIDISQFINLAILDAICETAFGIPIQAQFKSNRNFVEALTDFFEIFILRLFSVWLRNPVIFRMSYHYKRYKQDIKTVHDFINNIINDRKGEMSAKEANVQSVSDDGTKRRTALLDMLLGATFNGEGISNEDIREEVANFMFAGNDTTTAVLSFILYAVSQNKEIQQKLYGEIVDIVGTDSKSEITISQINELKYLDMVVKEGLRHYPPGPIVERTIDSDWTIDETTIPKGTSVSIFIYGLHHLPEFYPEPDKFDPERFLPENQSSRPVYSYLPFSAGPRNCLGQKYAMVELKTCIIKWLLQFELMPDPDFEPLIGLCAVLRSTNGIKMNLRFRNKN